MSLLTARDRVSEIVLSPGLGDFALRAVTDRSYMAFADAVIDGALVSYCARHRVTGQWETGVGTYDLASNTLSRDSSFRNSLGTQAKIEFAAGIVDVWIDAIADGLNALTQQVINVKAPPFGAKGDGVTDDTVAIQAALDACFAAGGGYVIAPEGIYIYSAQIVVPRGVVLIGAGMGTSSLVQGTWFQAAVSFPPSTAHFFLGVSDALTFDTRIQDCRIRCGDIAGSIGVDAPTIQENSGLVRVLIQSYRDTGVRIIDQNSSTLFASNWILDDCQCWCSSSATGSIGVDVTTYQRTGVIRKLSVVPNGSPADQLAGVRVTGAGGDGGGPRIYDLHVERHTDALSVGALGSCRAEHVTLFVSGSNVVQLSATVQDVTLVDVFRHASITGNTILDNRAGVAMTKTFVAEYQGSSSTEGYQAVTSGGSTTTESGNVVSASSPSHTVASTATSTSAARAKYRLRDGSRNGWDIEYEPDAGTTLPLVFRPVAASTVASAVLGITKAGGMRNLPTTNGPTGTFTMAAAATKAVANTNVTGSSMVFLQATNAAAAALMAGTSALYISATTNTTSFTVATADGGSAAGTETFNYWIVN